MEARIAALLAGTAVVEPYTPTCRTCERKECNGRCWGFWAETPDPFHVEVGARRALHADGHDVLD